MPITETDPFASTSLMEDRSQGAITTASHPHLARELEAATRDIKDFCRWHISPRKSVTQKRRGRFAEDVWLQAMQIESIDAVTIDGVEYTEDQVAAVEFDEDTGWTNLRGRLVEVTFTAGFVEVPETVETATLELAAAGLGTALGAMREQAGSVSITFDRAGGGIEEGSVLARRLLPYQIGRLP